MLSGNLTDSFYDGIEIYEVLKEAARRINQPGKIRIITLDGDDESEKTIKNEISKINKEIGVEVIKYAPAVYNGDQMQMEHFLLVDGKRYRIESPHQKITGKVEETKADVCCNAPDEVNRRLAFFDAAWNNLTAQA